MVCNNCGNTIPDGSSMCPFCGNPVEGAEMEFSFGIGGSDMNTIQQTPPPVKKASSKVLWILFAGTILFQVFSGIALVGGLVKSVYTGLESFTNAGEYNIPKEDENIQVEEVTDEVKEEPTDNEVSNLVTSTVTKQDITVSVKGIQTNDKNTFVNLEITNNGSDEITVNEMQSKLVVSGEQYEAGVSFEKGDLSYADIMPNATVNGTIMFDGSLDVEEGDKFYIDVINMSTYDTIVFELIF